MKRNYPNKKLIQLKNDCNYGSLYLFKPWGENKKLLENKKNIIVIFGKHYKNTPDDRIYGGGYSYLLKPEKTFMKLSVKNVDEKELRLKIFLKEKNIRFLKDFGHEIIEIDEKTIEPIFLEFINKMNDDNYFDQLKIKFGLNNKTFFCKELIEYVLNNFYKNKINKLNMYIDINNFNDNYLINENIINNIINELNNIDDKENIDHKENTDNEKYYYYENIIKRILENYFRVLIIFYDLDITKIEQDEKKIFLIDNISKNFKINKNVLNKFLNILNKIIYNNNIKIIINKTMEKFNNYTNGNDNDNIIQKFYMDTLCPNQITRHETAEVNTNPDLVKEKINKILDYDKKFFDNFNLDKDYITDLTAGTGIYLIIAFNILNKKYSQIILNDKQRVNKIASKLLYGDINPVSAMIYKLIMMKYYNIDEEILDNNILIDDTTNKKKIDLFFGDKIKNTILWLQNPPYNGGQIYYNFIKLSDYYVKKGGYICMISPYAFLSSSNKSSEILDIFTKNKVIYHNIDECAKWFPGIGSSFNYYIIKKEESNKDFETIVETNKCVIKKKYSNMINFKINNCYFIPKTYFKNKDEDNIDIKILKKIINYNNTENKLEKYMIKNNIKTSCINKILNNKKVTYYLWTNNINNKKWYFDDINDEDFNFLKQYMHDNDKNNFNNKCIKKPNNKGKGIILNIKEKDYQIIKNKIFPYIFYNTNAQNRIMHCSKKYNYFKSDKILICRLGNPHPTRSQNSNFNGDVRAIINNDLDYYNILLKETNILKNYLKKIYDTGNAFVDIKIFYNIKTLDNISKDKDNKDNKESILNKIYNHYGLTDEEINRINTI